jgi:hypothetical protein
MNSSPLKSGSGVKGTGTANQLNCLLLLTRLEATQLAVPKVQIKIPLFFNGITDKWSQHGAMVE